jgi:hypothetical protein
MGFCFSPYIAQSIAWTLLLHCEAGAVAFFAVTGGNGERLPRYVDVVWQGQTVGFACITYDNFGIFLNTEDRELTSKITRRLVQNAKHFQIVWKELSVHRSGEVQHIIKRNADKAPKRARVDHSDCEEKPIEADVPTKNAIFLGVEIEIGASSLDEIRWRHAPKRKEKMSKLADIPKTNRQVAEIVGHVVWDTLISLRRLSEVSDIINLLKVLAKQIQKKSDWDKELHAPPPRSWIEAVKKWKSFSINNPWICNRPDYAFNKAVFVCSDAADTKLGGVEISTNAPAVVDCWHQDANKNTHIFIKEVLAAVYTVRWTAMRNPQRPLCINLAIDSIPARRALEKAYSSNDHVCKLMARFWQWLDEEHLFSFEEEKRKEKFVRKNIFEDKKEAKTNN